MLGDKISHWRLWSAGICAPPTLPRSRSEVALIQANITWGGDQRVDLFDNLVFGHSWEKNAVRHGRTYKKTGMYTSWGHFRTWRNRSRVGWFQGFREAPWSRKRTQGVIPEGELQVSASLWTFLANIPGILQEALVKGLTLHITLLVPPCPKN